MRKRIGKGIIMTFLTAIMITTATGCGAKKDKELTSLDDIPTAESEAADSEQTDTVTENGNVSEADEDTAEETLSDAQEPQISAEEIQNLRPYIVSVDRYAEDELGLSVVGYMSIDYAEIDDESRILCPELAKSLDEFNAGRKQEYNSLYPEFCEAANNYNEYKYEATHSEDADLAAGGFDSCIDYNFLDVMRADNVAMSILVTDTKFWGEDETKTTYTGVSYDSQTGEELKLSDIVSDVEAYENAVIEELERKYGSVSNVNVKFFDYQGWVLTPEGIIIYSSEDQVSVPEGGYTSVQVNFDEHPEVFKDKYCLAPDEYAIPFRGNEIIYIDSDRDSVDREAVVYSPLGIDEQIEAGEYSSYKITVDGKSYDAFDEDWFYGYNPYYVHKKDGTYLYVYTAGYEGDFISVIKFVGEEPICVKKLPATPFDVDMVDDSDEEFINRHIAVSNPGMIEDALSFDTNICGMFKGEEGDGWEVRYWDICNIDGKYYLDYIGEYDFSAAEIELLDETPYLAGDELRYMVKVYPYSGFSFGGEYWGAGQVMYMSANLETASRRITLSSGNPFFYGEQMLNDVEGIHMHEVQDRCVANTVAPEIIGSWRSKVEDDGREYEVYMQFGEDGLVDIVSKSECYTPKVYRGIYSLQKTGDIFTGRIEAEAMGMGSQPMADWVLEFDPSADDPIKITDEYEASNPFVYGVDEMNFSKTMPGKTDKYIHPGPWDRTEEVTEMWDEYNSVVDDSPMYYDFQPEYIDAIHESAVEMAGGTGYRGYGIQDNKKGGEIWIEILEDITPSVQTTKTWVRYDMSDLSYYDIYGNCLDEE